jgi:hypothetical protein
VSVRACRSRRSKRLVLTTATAASLQSFTYSKSDASSTDLSIEPGFDYFVADGVSVGIDAELAHSGGASFDSTGAKTDSSSTSYGLAPRLDFHSFLVGEVLSIWPQAEIGIGSLTQEESAAGGTNEHERSRVWVEASLPVLVHATSHLFMGAGPYVDHELSDVDQFQYKT